ncbi:histidine kinase dimerization/phospho-acceptor domain-containing protein [uncultured Xylophilus sp.]|uniref:histidine kinase dimerization/phospho-acceptor domain-containing protein n=1 Tax=uncultured Xylophilus sp. TaxID=296832 RepID=UPI0025E6BF7C|nr:histidine kinase dimerization/phospho-acceptor domain-containing protein [uncultured Xylophilus sp.]
MPSKLKALAHALRTPLSGLASALEVVKYREDLGPHQLEEALEVAKRQIDRMNMLLQLLDAFAVEPMPRQDVRLDIAIHRSLMQFHQSLPHGMRVPASPVMVYASEELLTHTLVTVIRDRQLKARPCVPYLRIEEYEVAVVWSVDIGNNEIPQSFPTHLKLLQDLTFSYGGRLDVFGSNAEIVQLVLPRYNPVVDLTGNTSAH